jgi:hypothetical protein
MWELLTIAGLYLLVYASVGIAEAVVANPRSRFFASVGIYISAALGLLLGYAERFQGILTPTTAVLLLIILSGAPALIHWLADTTRPRKLGSRYALILRVSDLPSPLWRTVGRIAARLFWQNSALVAVLLVMFSEGWTIWFVLGLFFMGMALAAIAGRVWRHTDVYAGWILLTISLPALVYIVLFFPYGFALLLALQLALIVGLRLEVEWYQVSLDSDVTADDEW